MTKIEQLMCELCEIGSKPKDASSKLLFQAKLLEVVALLTVPNELVDIPTTVFECMDNEMRNTMLLLACDGFIQVLGTQKSL